LRKSLCCFLLLNFVSLLSFLFFSVQHRRLFAFIPFYIQRYKYYYIKMYIQEKSVDKWRNRQAEKRLRRAGAGYAAAAYNAGDAICLGHWPAHEVEVEL